MYEGLCESAWFSFEEGGGGLEVSGYRWEFLRLGCLGEQRTSNGDRTRSVRQTVWETGGKLRYIKGMSHGGTGYEN